MVLFSLWGQTQIRVYRESNVADVIAENRNSIVCTCSSQKLFITVGTKGPLWNVVWCISAQFRVQKSFPSNGTSELNTIYGTASQPKAQKSRLHLLTKPCMGLWVYMCVEKPVKWKMNAKTLVQFSSIQVCILLIKQASLICVLGLQNEIHVFEFLNKRRGRWSTSSTAKTRKEQIVK